MDKENIRQKLVEGRLRKYVSDENDKIKNNINKHVSFGYEQGIKAVLQSLKNCDENIYQNYTQWILNNGTCDSCLKDTINEINKSCEPSISDVYYWSKKLIDLRENKITYHRPMYFCPVCNTTHGDTVTSPNNNQFYIETCTNCMRKKDVDYYLDLYELAFENNKINEANDILYKINRDFNLSYNDIFNMIKNRIVTKL